MSLPSLNGRQCEADSLPVSGEVPGEAPESSVVPKTNTRSSVYKGEPHKMSKCRKKINLDVANFQLNKSTTQIWVTHHQYGISGLVLWTGHVGQGGEQLWRREMSAFLFLRLLVLRFASIKDKPSVCVKEDQRHLNCKSFSLGKILLSQR